MSQNCGMSHQEITRLLYLDENNGRRGEFDDSEEDSDSETNETDVIMTAAPSDGAVRGSTMCIDSAVIVDKGVKTNIT